MHKFWLFYFLLFLIFWLVPLLYILMFRKSFYKIVFILFVNIFSLIVFFLYSIFLVPLDIWIDNWILIIVSTLLLFIILKLILFFYEYKYSQLKQFNKYIFTIVYYLLTIFILSIFIYGFDWNIFLSFFSFLDFFWRKLLFLTPLVLPIFIDFNYIRYNLKRIFWHFSFWLLEFILIFLFIMIFLIDDYHMNINRHWGSYYVKFIYEEVHDYLWWRESCYHCKDYKNISY